MGPHIQCHIISGVAKYAFLEADKNKTKENEKQGPNTYFFKGGLKR